MPRKPYKAEEIVGIQSGSEFNNQLIDEVLDIFHIRWA